MFYKNILDHKRQELLPQIASVAQGFYLAGGTSLALQLGHRDSIDFDFFTPGNIDTSNLYREIERVFSGHSLLKTQDEKDTLSLIIDNEIRLSFFGYPYALLSDLIIMDNISLASILDIGCMKLSAITSRSTLKDYVDLYFILKVITLDDLIAGCKQKFPTLDEALVLKSLVYTADIEIEPILFTNENTVTLVDINDFLATVVSYYLRST